MTTHSHGTQTHDHDAPDGHDHHPPHGHLRNPDGLDADTGTTCGHLGTDPATVRHVVQIGGRPEEWVLCGDCLNADWWAEREAEAQPPEEPE